MGAAVCRAVEAAEDLDLVAAVDPGSVGASLSGAARVPGCDLVVCGGPEEMAGRHVEVAVDFTVAASALENIAWCIRSGINVVVGTTGISPGDLDAMRLLLDENANRSGVFFAPNFAIGAVLMMRFCRMAAAWMPDAEVIELHHADKRDSPSGTSIATVREILAGRAGARVPMAPRPDEPVAVLPGARGADAEGVHIHSVRLPGLVAHQEVLFGGPGQGLSIRHDTSDRVAFMPGVLLAIREVAGRPGLTVGLEALLDS
jgi:4-hydroxy-tetrahydrodipicolinate reductase